MDARMMPTLFTPAASNLSLEFHTHTVAKIGEISSVPCTSTNTTSKARENSSLAAGLEGVRKHPPLGPLLEQLNVLVLI
jgi:hypothetical protein